MQFRWFTNLFKGNKDEDGYYPVNYSDLLGVTPRFNDYGGDLAKIQSVFENPAVLKVFALQCDLFSLGKIYVYKGDKEVKDDPILKVFENPNPLQSGSQWLWDFMFWNMIGTAYCYVDSDIPGAENRLYFLDHSKIEFPREMDKLADKLLLSKKSVSDLAKINIKYKYNDGTSIDIPFSKITTITDLTNGIGNWFKSPSRIEALHKIITNSDESLKSDNINIRLAGKFMVAGMQNPNNVTQLPMGEEEKKDIETKMNGRKQIHAVKSMIDIKRFVEDRSRLELDKAYLGQYFLIGSMYGIPRDVLEAYVSSTYENQEKARGSHVSYTLQPKGDDITKALAARWGYSTQGKSIIIDWSHLPFMQVFEAERMKTKKIQADTFKLLLDQGVNLDEVNQFLDTTFKTGEKNAQPQIINQPTTVAAGN